MKNTPQTSYDTELSILINKYATPLAILLTALGIVLSQPTGAVRIISLSLLVFGIVLNTVTLYAIKRSTETKAWFMELRMCLNLGVNTILVYFLGAYWPPIWLLLALTPVATAVYSTRAQTLRVSGGVSFLLLVIHAARRLNSPAEWGQQIACVIFILLLSLMINELAHATKLSKTKWNSSPSP